MSNPNLGALIDATAQRDAIHLAIAPVVASMKLYPGQDIGFVKPDHLTVGTGVTPIGIVDPFLKHAVSAGDRFWLFLYSQTITSLRHDWTHPAFEASTISQVDHKDKSIEWLKAQAIYMDITYNGLMEAAHRWVVAEDHTVQHGSETWRDMPPKDMAEFWHHYQIVTGEKPVDAEQWFFCCSC